MATKVTINGREYVYRYDFGSLLHYEQIIKKLESKTVITELVSSALMHYSCLMSGSKFELTMSYEEFLTEVTSQSTLDELNKAFEREYARWEDQSPLQEDNADSTAKKK